MPKLIKLFKINSFQTMMYGVKLLAIILGMTLFQFSYGQTKND
ncbi:MAG: hypothetical protein ACJARP_003099, partial [Vicingaceae bacterium]